MCKKGHIPWNKGLKNSQIPWNKGLTSSTDCRVAKYAKSGGLSRRGKPPWSLGKKFTAQHRKNLSKAHLGVISIPKGTPSPLKKPTEKRYCKLCNKEFEIRITSNKKFCSKSCLLKYVHILAKGRPTSNQTKLKLSLSCCGSKSYLWKGGITRLYRNIRLSFIYRQWRSDILTRDNFTCRDCSVRGGKLQVHHIKSFAKIIEEYKIKTFEEAMACEELWNINNGITVHKSCHHKRHRKGYQE